MQLQRSWAVLVAGSVVLSWGMTSARAAERSKPEGQQQTSRGGADDSFTWPNEAPADCPFPPSTVFSGITFTGRHAEHGKGADTWYPSWAANGNMYSPWTDGGQDGLVAYSWGRGAAGHATIEGDDPLHLKITNVGVVDSTAAPYGGRYPCGSLVYKGVWYYGTYGLHPSSGEKRDGWTYNWPWLGPLVGFRYSTDYGKTWMQTPCTPRKPLFGEQALQGEPVKIGAAHFVDFGKDMEHSPDGKAYLVSHGASDGRNRRFGYNSWITGDEIYMVRVVPSIENINDASKYEFCDGTNWSKDFKQLKPIAAWRDHMGCVTMTYNAPLKRYLMCVTDGQKTQGYYHTYILESDRITGPFNMVHFLRNFGDEAYFVNIPSKFISADGLTFWLCYSANFSSKENGQNLQPNPPGSCYAMCLREVRLRPR